MVATTFSEESGHNSLPWASVLGAGGAVVVAFVEVRAAGVVVFDAVVFGAVAFGAVAFGAVAFGAVAFGAVAFGAVAVCAVLVAAVVLSPVVVTLAVVVGAGFAGVVGALVLADVTDAGAPVDAADPVDAAPGELAGTTAVLAASTPVRVGVDELLTSPASPALLLPAAALERPAMTKIRPISTAMAATIRETRRSQ